MMSEQSSQSLLTSDRSVTTTHSNGTSGHQSRSQQNQNEGETRKQVNITVAFRYLYFVYQASLRISELLFLITCILNRQKLLESFCDAKLFDIQIRSKRSYSKVELWWLTFQLLKKFCKIPQRLFQKHSFNNLLCVALSGCWYAGDSGGFAYTVLESHHEE